MLFKNKERVHLTYNNVVMKITVRRKSVDLFNREGSTPSAPRISVICKNLTYVYFNFKLLQLLDISHT
jgi:hypothetical protein